MSKLLLLIVVSLISCKPKTSQVKALSNVDDLIWPKQKFRLCINPIPSQDDFAFVNDMIPSFIQQIKQNYNPSSTLAHFYDFSACTDGEYYDVALILIDNNQASSLTGYSSYSGRLSTETNSVDSKSIPEVFVSMLSAYKEVIGVAPMQATHPTSDKDFMHNFQLFLQETIVHELGHFLGLNHEHVHPQSTCRFENPRYGRKQVEYPGDHPVSYKTRGMAYDPFSIMSYCKMMTSLLSRFRYANSSLYTQVKAFYPESEVYDEQLRFDPKFVSLGLSEGDIKTIADLYRDKTQIGPIFGTGDKDLNPTPP